MREMQHKMRHDCRARAHYQSPPIAVRVNVVFEAVVAIVTWWGRRRRQKAYHFGENGRLNSASFSFARTCQFLCNQQKLDTTITGEWVVRWREQTNWCLDQQTKNRSCILGVCGRCEEDDDDVRVRRLRHYRRRLLADDRHSTRRARSLIRRERASNENARSSTLVVAAAAAAADCSD